MKNHTSNQRRVFDPAPSEKTVIACDMCALAAAEREKHTQNTMQLFARKPRVRELRNGYRFDFVNDSETITQIGEFAVYERLCCPFLNFGLAIHGPRQAIRFSVTGPEAAKEFIKTEFSALIDDQ